MLVDSDVLIWHLRGSASRDEASRCVAAFDDIRRHLLRNTARYAQPRGTDRGAKELGPSWCRAATADSGDHSPRAGDFGKPLAVARARHGRCPDRCHSSRARIDLAYCQHQAFQRDRRADVGEIRSGSVASLTFADMLLEPLTRLTQLDCSQSVIQLCPLRWRSDCDAGDAANNSSPALFSKQSRLVRSL